MGSFMSLVSPPFRISLRGANHTQAHFADETGQWIVTARGGPDGDIKFWYADANRVKVQRKVGLPWCKLVGGTTFKPPVLIALGISEGHIHHLGRGISRICPCFGRETRR